jgi:queuine tRNA-ribosyltransferase
VQGGIFEDLRAESARTLTALGFPGYAIGGLSVGESKADMLRILDSVTPLLPETKPRYLMGVGSPEDLVEGVARGIDIFDCVMPTRLARNGSVFTPSGRMNLRNAQYREDPRPIQEGCGCYTCRNFSRAYLRHLLIAKELLAPNLNTLHNVHYLLDLMVRIRASIEGGTFADLRAEFWSGYRVVDEDVRRRDKAVYKSALRARN